MKDRRDKPPILAAGGIVLRGERKPQIAVVQLRKMGVWMLPKGKLAAGEDMLMAARREVLEETGHRVAVHEFLGTLAYEAGGRPKVVQFWRMQALGGPVGPLMRDVRAVDWLSLDEALDRLTHAREHAFLAQVGPVALKAAERSLRRAAERTRRPVERPAPHPALVDPTPWLAPVDHAAPAPVDSAPIIGPVDPVPAAAPAPAVTAAPFVSAPAPSADDMTSMAAAGHGVLERTWQWIRELTQAQRPHRA
jgi:8-oxo-dGTP diphosphatase